MKVFRNAEELEKVNKIHKGNVILNSSSEDKLKGETESKCNKSK